MNTIRLTAAIALLFSASAFASPVTCLPKQFGGSGTSAIFKSNSKGDFGAYYCPGEPFPTMFVCMKSTCSLVGTKRAVAAFISNPSIDGLNEALSSLKRDPLRDPELKTVWLPHIEEIAALAKQ